MFEKIFGKRRSIRRSLVIDFIIATVIVVIISIGGFSLFVSDVAAEKLIQINASSPEQIKEILTILRRGAALLAFSTIIIGEIVMRLASKKMLKPIQQITEATQKVASGNFNVELKTERKDEIGELTENFNKMVKDLKSIECLQKEFIDNVSHEIKTPITSIQGFSQLLEDDSITNEERKEYCEIIKEESNRLLNLSTNILKLSKLQNQNEIVNKKQVDVAEQLRKAVALLEPKWKEKEITFNVSLDEKYFYGDEELLFQVWINLIDNAIKFSNLKGKIDVVLKQKNQTIEVQIKDHGTGMSEEEKDRIFKRFYQIDKSHSEQGSGLGLAIAKRIVDLSGGTITVNSKENVGTTMIVSLPVEDETNRILIV